MDIYEVTTNGGDDEAPQDLETMCMLGFVLSEPQHAQAETSAGYDANGDIIILTRYTITNMVAYKTFRESFMAGYDAAQGSIDEN